MGKLGTGKCVLGLRKIAFERDNGYFLLLNPDGGEFEAPLSSW